MSFRINEPLIPGGIVFSSNATYEVLSILGEGGFGKVMKCRRTDVNGGERTVALKTLEKSDGIREVLMLQRIKTLNSSFFVHWEQAFIDRQHFCLEFETLDQSLLDIMLERQGSSLHLTEIRPIIEQLASGLCQLKEAGILHADLKLNNVMLVNHKQEPWRIKIIDFGLAMEASQAQRGRKLQTIMFRSPEIILGLPYSEAIDMWSVGLMAACMFLGDLLYPGMDEYDMLRYITDTQGPIPQHMLSSGLKTKQFFKKDSEGLWRLKTPEQFLSETGIHSYDTRTHGASTLDQLEFFQVTEWQAPEDEAANKADRQMFVDLLKKMLILDPSQRITPHEVLAHSFITLDHLKAFNSDSNYALSSISTLTEPWIPKLEKQRCHRPSGVKRKRNADDSDDDYDEKNSPQTSHRPSKKIKTSSHLDGPSHAYPHVEEHPAQPPHHSIQQSGRWKKRRADRRRKETNRDRKKQRRDPASPEAKTQMRPTTGVEHQDAGPIKAVSQSSQVQPDRPASGHNKRKRDNEDQAETTRIRKMPRRDPAGSEVKTQKCVTACVKNQVAGPMKAGKQCNQIQPDSPASRKNKRKRDDKDQEETAEIIKRQRRDPAAPEAKTQMCANAGAEHQGASGHYKRKRDDEDQVEMARVRKRTRRDQAGPEAKTQMCANAGAEHQGASGHYKRKRDDEDQVEMARVRKRTRRDPAAPEAKTQVCANAGAEHQGASGHYKRKRDDEDQVEMARVRKRTRRDPAAPEAKTQVCANAGAEHQGASGHYKRKRDDEDQVEMARVRKRTRRDQAGPEVKTQRCVTAMVEHQVAGPMEAATRRSSIRPDPPAFGRNKRKRDDEDQVETTPTRKRPRRDPAGQRKKEGL